MDPLCALAIVAMDRGWNSASNSFLCTVPRPRSSDSRVCSCQTWFSRLGRLSRACHEGGCFTQSNRMLLFAKQVCARGDLWVFCLSVRRASSSRPPLQLPSLKNLGSCVQVTQGVLQLSSDLLRNTWLAEFDFASGRYLARRSFPAFATIDALRKPSTREV